MPRIERFDLFMSIAELYANRSTCKRAKVGVVAVRDGRIVAAGYNGAPAGAMHCIDAGCILEGNHCIRAVHAEANMVSWAARVGTPLLKTNIYSTHEPCIGCAKLLVNCGIESLCCSVPYPSGGKSLLQTSGVQVIGPYGPAVVGQDTQPKLH